MAWEELGAAPQLPPWSRWEEPLPGMPWREAHSWGGTRQGTQREQRERREASLRAPQRLLAAASQSGTPKERHRPKPHRIMQLLAVVASLLLLFLPPVVLP